MTKMTAQKQTFTRAEGEELIKVLKARFAKHINRHAGISWDDVGAKLEAGLSGDKTLAAKLRSLHAMEKTGGEPDVVALEKKSRAFIFYDCAAESPKGRRSLCYDVEALASRKQFKPKDSALGMAEAMNISLLTEEQYRFLQELGKFDQKTSSWVWTPPAIRKLGGALFCDRRYNTVFLYHNGAESYYAARGFRASLSL